MIEFFSENEFQLVDDAAVIQWLSQLISSEEYTLGDISFVFCNDTFLHGINLEFLNHDTFTDIVSFDYSLGKELHGEIYISTERVAENASELGVSFLDELHRVIVHGVLHLCGYKDKTNEQKKIMREKEDSALELLKDINI
ncbi:MAG: rRNA maturation RNase YbeY [Bacteroidota bacterium]